MPITSPPWISGPSKERLPAAACPTNRKKPRKITALADRWETSEAQEGIAAFFDKRPAPWA